MSLITELIEFALQHDMLTEEHKRKLQDDGLYTFNNEKDEDNCSLEDRKKLAEEFPRFLTLWDSWKAGKLERVFADGFTLNDIYALINAELPNFHEFSRFRQQILEEVRTLYETDREMFGALSENAVQAYTTSMKVWTILNLPSMPVTPERIEEILTWKTELAIAMLINLDYITELVQRDWSDLMVITECKIENTILKSVIIPEGVTKIGDYAFYDCSSLTSVSIPDGVKKIGDSVFWNCSSLTSVTIPEGVKTIRACAFQGCSSLTSITIPEGVKWIWDNAFWNCSSLTSVTIPEGVTVIRRRTFWYCSSLSSVTIPEGVKWIDCEAFTSCSSLTSVAIPKGVKWIGGYAFCDCSSLTSVVIPKGGTRIGTGAFKNCPNLTIHAPAGSYAEQYAKENKIPFQPLEDGK